MGDKRRNERFVSIINGINKQPGSSIPKRSESWYEAKATYNFFSNANITIPELQKAIKYYGGNKVKGLKKVLAAHDFCQVSYNNLAAVELGYRANKDGRGIITYNSIAISEDGIPLSLQYQQTFLRPLEDLGKAT